MLSNRDDEDWFANQKRSLDSAHIDVTYTAPSVDERRLKTDLLQRKQEKYYCIEQTQWFLLDYLPILWYNDINHHRRFYCLFTLPLIVMATPYSIVATTIAAIR